MQAKTKRMNNAVTSAADSTWWPFMKPDYPVKPWMNAVTGVWFMTASFRQDDGSFIAFIAEDESVWAVGKSRREAEEAVKAAYSGRRD